jgi:hypothetical protein
MKQRFSFVSQVTGEAFRVELEINVEELAREMANRAFFGTKSGKATALDKTIICTVVARGEAAKHD